MSSPVAVDTNNDRSIDTVYAGDLYGNLWKFDVSGTVGSYPAPSSPLFVACTTTGVCSAANRQPITGKPNVGPVGADQNGIGLMVYFGTGQYFATGDNIVGTSPQVQTFYGLWDQNNGSTITRANLQEQTIIYEGIATTVSGIATTNPVVVVSKNSVCYATTSVGCHAASSTESASPLKKGWALNLLSPTGIAKSERVVSFPLVIGGWVAFTTLIPNPDPCASELGGGTSHFMEVGALSGGQTAAVPFGISSASVVNNTDLVTITIGDVSSTVVASGIDLGIGIIGTPTVIEATTVAHKYFSGSTGQNANLPEAPLNPPGRQSWRQLE